MGFVSPPECKADVGMFLEFKTIWKRFRKYGDAATQYYYPNLANTLPLSSEFRERRRKVGILFSKQSNLWNFLVLIGPGNDMLGFSIVEIEEDDEIPNATLYNGNKGRCHERPLSIKNTINYINSGLNKHGPKFVESLARDVLCGWDEFLKEMRHEIVEVDVK